MGSSLLGAVHPEKFLGTLRPHLINHQKTCRVMFSVTLFGRVAGKKGEGGEGRMEGGGSEGGREETGAKELPEGPTFGEMDKETASHSRTRNCRPGKICFLWRIPPNKMLHF